MGFAPVSVGVPGFWASHLGAVPAELWLVVSEPELLLLFEFEPGDGVTLGDGLGLDEGDASGLPLGPADGLGDTEGVADGDGEGSTDGLGLGEGVGSGVGLGFILGLGETDGDGLADGLGLGEGLGKLHKSLVTITGIEPMYDWFWYQYVTYMFPVPKFNG